MARQKESYFQWRALLVRRVSRGFFRASLADSVMLETRRRGDCAIAYWLCTYPKKLQKNKVHIIT
eukprot:13472655-Ditylum_brightwellii.AAC.1